MKIDLHIHTATGSDGAMTLTEVFHEAARRGIEFISITDHDNIDCQPDAVKLAAARGMSYITGVELNITFAYQGKDHSLDFLGYGYDYRDAALCEKLRLVKARRIERARQIMDNLNGEFNREGRPLLTEEDMAAMQAGVDGVLGRPHIADFLVKTGVVAGRQEAFDRCLVRLNVPKYPLRLEEASALVRRAGGRLVLAHPNDTHGTSLVSITSDLAAQTEIVEKEMLGSIDGVECWHSRADAATTARYVAFCREHNLLMTGGSDCHQKPVIMGTVPVPEWVGREILNSKT
jgi:predicted metal-dependent phosphoesterase TrpH